MYKKGIKQKIRDLKRFKFIIATFAGHGFGFLLEQLNLPFSCTKKKINKNISLPARTRIVFEKLGPTFIKLGQVLSMRPDILPHKYVQEFEKLQDSAPSFPFNIIKKQVQTELGKPLNQSFKKFTEKPIAAASIAQVHDARLLGNQKVAVKIQRPEIEKNIRTDLNILYFLAEIAEKRIPESISYKPTEVVREFEKAIFKELDFTMEGHNIEKFRMNFQNDSSIVFPKVHWNFSTKKILTMEYIEGIKISEIGKLKRQKINLKAIAEKSANAFFKQVFLDGFFHADPHSGNIFVTKDEEIVFLDCGMVGHINSEMKVYIADLLLAVVGKNSKKIVNIFEDMDVLNENIDTHKLQLDIAELINKYYDTSLKQIKIGQIMDEMMDVIGHHQIRMPADFTLLAKATVAIEEIGQQLDPHFNTTKQIKPFAKKILWERLSPQKITSSLGENLYEIQKFFLNIPRDLNIFSKKLRHGKISINLKHKGLENLISEIHRSSNILSFSLLISALIVGSSLLVQSGVGQKEIFGIPLLGFAGFSVAIFMALIWFIAILQKNKF